MNQYSWITGAAPTNSNLFNIINGLTESKPVGVFDVLKSVYNQQTRSKDQVQTDPAFVNIFLQYPNEIIQNLAMQIVDPVRDTDDEKMEKIQRWVVYNIEYMEDKEQYGYDELWVPPVMLLKTMKGDCEDGAFMIMSLALNAGVDPNRLLFYGGEVKAGRGAATGGHGWVAYQRESDNKWIPIDFSYYPDLGPMENRTPMKDDERYVRQYFMFDIASIIKSDLNRVRQPTTYTRQATIQPNVLLPGTWLSTYT